jgi:hypothetical protein
LIPVVDSDESCKACGVLLGSLVSMTQLATLTHLSPFTLTLFSRGSREFADSGLL